ncbi:DUF7533 family protein [Natronomonas moolapensis]|nr:hypothetical protein [Natronomonas moolapensis]
MTGRPRPTAEYITVAGEPPGMALGIVRTLQLARTLVVAGPVGLIGAFSLLEGRYVHGVFFVTAALGLVGVSEYVYLRLADRTVGRLRNVRGGE